MCDGKPDSEAAFAQIQAIKKLVSRSKIDRILGDHKLARYCKRITDLQLIWLIIGMGLFGNSSYRQIFRLCTSARPPVPSRATLTMARKRISAKLFKLLYHGVVTCLAKSPEKHPFAFYKNLRLMGVDGTLLSCPDTDSNRKAFGRPSNQKSDGAFPKARVVSLCELGTRVLWRSVSGGYRESEQKLALQLLEFLNSDMLLLGDRYFGVAPIIYRLLTQAVAFLIRVKKSQCFPVEKVLSDGSYLSTIYLGKNGRRAGRAGKTIRVIRYMHNDPKRPGCGVQNVLVTSLLDADKYPAIELIELYHVRWEQEIAFSEWKVVLQQKKVLCSQNSEMVLQEIWGLLISHFIIRKLIFDGAEFAGVPPAQISFKGALNVLQARLPKEKQSQSKVRKWFKNLIEEISLERLPPRRNRINPRKIKKRSTAWPSKKDCDRNPPKPSGPFIQNIVISI